MNLSRCLRALVTMPHLLTFALVTSVASSAESDNTFETPSFELVMTVRASVDTMVDMGKTPTGARRVVPIIGGTFEGREMKGTIMPGGEDWQLLRDDGVLELDARYWLRTDDGVLIRVHNQVLSAPAPQGAANAKRYSRSSVRLEAPIGKYDWLNKAIFIGTITADPTQKPAVVTLRFFKVN